MRFTRKKPRSGFRRKTGISTVVASIFFIMILALSIAFLEYTLYTASNLMSMQTEAAVEKMTVTEMASSISGWWLIDSSGNLVIRFTARTPYATTVTGLFILYGGGDYDAVARNINTVGARLVSSFLIEPNGVQKTIRLVFPLTIGYGESIQITIVPRSTSVSAVALSITKQGATAVAAANLLNYRELYGNITPTAIAPYTIALAPQTLYNGTVATLGYTVGSTNTTAYNITTTYGTPSGDVGATYSDDNIYYNISSATAYAAEPWLSGWEYRVPITITERTGESLASYQLEVVLNSTTVDHTVLDHIFSNTKPGGGDIRFTLGDGVTEIPYWVQEWNSTGETAIVWVKVPLIPGGSTTTIYMYYGNPQAPPASNLTSIIEELPAASGGNYAIYYQPWDMGASLINVPGNVLWSDFDDDDYLVYTLPFSFPYYSSTFSSVYIISNGHIDLGAIETDYQSTVARFTSTPMISPFWADLIDDDGARTGYAVFYNDTYADEYGRGVYIVWISSFYLWPWNSGTQVFGVVLYENGMIRFDYGAITGFSSTDDTPVVGVSAGNGTHYTLLVTGDNEPASNWDNHPSIMLWPRKKAVTEPLYSIGRVESRTYYVAEVVASHSIPLNTTTGYIYFRGLANTTAIVDFYLWNGSSWVYARNLTIDKPGTEYSLLIPFTDKFVVSPGMRYKIEVVNHVPFTISIDVLRVKAYYPTGSPRIYVGVGGGGSILVYDVSSKTFTGNISAPPGVVFNATTALAFDPRGRLWVVAGSTLYYYDIAGRLWRKYAIMPAAAGEGSSLLPYNGRLYVILGGGSTLMLVYNVAVNSTSPTLVDLGYSVGAYATATLGPSGIYIAIGGGSTTFIKYDLKSNTTTALESTPLSAFVGLSYDESTGLIWAIGRGGGLYYYDPASNTWSPAPIQIPYTPQTEGNRLVCYNGILYHFRADGSRELWIIAPVL